MMQPASAATTLGPHPALLPGDPSQLAQILELQQGLLLPGTSARAAAEGLVQAAVSLFGVRGAAIGLERGAVYELAATAGATDPLRAAYDGVPVTASPIAEVLSVGRSLVLPATDDRATEIVLPLRGPDVVGALHVVLAPGAAVSETVAQTASVLRALAATALGNAAAWERASRASRIRRDVLAAMAHDLRAPLGALLGYVQLLAEGTFGPLTPEQTEVLQTLGRQGRELTDLLAATLDVAREDAGRIPVRAATFALDEVIDALRTGTFAGPTGSGAVSWRLAPDLPRLESDRVKVREIIQNLVDNALKHGGAPVEVDISPVPGRDVVRLTVRDHGPGIAAQVRPHLFEPFRPGGPDGTGLGLYIVRCFAEALGGRVAARSAPHDGTAITVELPRIAPARPQ